MFPRYITHQISAALNDTPVVFIAGPRQCGKTTLIRALIDEQWTFVSLDDQTQLSLAQADPVGFIRYRSDRPLVIDEVQRVPELLLAIKQAVDEQRQPGRFLLSGSSNVLVLPQVSDSLAGRVEVIEMAPLSEVELLERQPQFLDQCFLGQVPG